MGVATTMTRQSASVIASPPELVSAAETLR